LNGVPTTGNPIYARLTPLTLNFTNIHYAVGGYDFTNMGNTSGFQGKIGYLNIHDYPVESTWTNTNARFRPASQFYTAHFSTEAPSGVTSAVISWQFVLTQNVIGWTMTGLGVPAGTTVLIQTDNGNQTFMTLSQEISYHAVDYTFIAP
jgi:hypothetical protein